MASIQELRNPLVIPEVKLPRWFGRCMWRTISQREILSWPKPAYSELHRRDFFTAANKLRRNSDLAEFYEQLENLKLNGTVLRIRNLGVVPFSVNGGGRNQIRRKHYKTKFAERTTYVLQYLLAAADLRRLPESFGRSPEYTSSMVGEEVSGYRLSRFKLPNSPATLYPNKPLGPGIFDDEKGLNIDSISPDIIAFVGLDIADDAEATGPIVYSLTDLEEQIEKIAPNTLERLRSTMYEIRPDKALTNNLDQPNGFGGVSNINVFGMRDQSKQKYMRFDLDRLYHIELGGDAGPVGVLREATEAIKAAQCRIGIELGRGEILLVNNRNCALEWKRQGIRTSNLKFTRELSVFRPDDRIIVRSSFYLRKYLFR